MLSKTTQSLVNMEFRATFKFWNFKRNLNPTYRIFLNFDKSRVSCLSRFDSINTFHDAVFELELKL